MEKPIKWDFESGLQPSRELGKNNIIQGGNKMDSNNDLFCKIYVNVSINCAELVKLIADQISSYNIIRHDIETRFCNIFVGENDEYDEIKSINNSEQFLFYKFYLELEPVKGIARSDYIQSIGDLLNYLWGQGMSAVAASDFEYELPNNGG